MYPTLDEPEDLPGEVWNLREKGRKLKHWENVCPLIPIFVNLQAGHLLTARRMR
jgi:hypothetical protein